MAIRVTVQGARETREKLAAKRDRVRDMRPAFEVSADLLEAHVERIFETGGASISRGWLRHRASTVKARRRRWGYYRRAGLAIAAGKVLIWTGRAMRSFQRGGEKHRRIVTKDGLIWGSRYPLFNTRIRPIRQFRDDAQRRAITVLPLELWLGGASVEEMRMMAAARAGL